MIRQQLFRAGRLLGGLSLVVLTAGCATTPAEVPVEGAPAELSALAGHWEGEYSSQATGGWGRSFSISFPARTTRTATC
jgi:hypothetical protein